MIIDRELATVEQERARLVAAIAAGGQLDGLIQALQARETRRAELEARRDGSPAAHPIPVLLPSHGRVSGIDWDRRRGSSALDLGCRCPSRTV